MNCRFGDRDFCTPDGLVAALFVDIDGTLLVCQRYFDESHDMFARFMQLRGFDRQEAADLVRQTHLHVSEREGFERDKYTKALITTYQSLLSKHRRRFKRADVEQDHVFLRCIGSNPFFREPELFPDAASVLGRARHKFLIFAVSIGNREVQKYKVRKAGIDPHFDELIITASDNKPVLVNQLIKDHKINPQLSAYVGNSWRSDVPCLLHTNVIKMPFESWQFDQKHTIPQNTGFNLVEVASWREAEELGINRLIRHRDNGTSF